MQFDPAEKAKLIGQLAQISMAHEVASDGWIQGVSAFLDSLAPAPEPEPEVQEETMEERIARLVGVQGHVPEALPFEPPPQEQPRAQVNAVRRQREREIEEKLAAGEEITQRPAPQLNWQARVNGALVSKALIGPDNQPIVLPGGGAV